MMKGNIILNGLFVPELSRVFFKTGLNGRFYQGGKSVMLEVFCQSLSSSCIDLIAARNAGRSFSIICHTLSKLMPK